MKISMLEVGSLIYGIGHVSAQANACAHPALQDSSGRTCCQGQGRKAVSGVCLTLGRYLYRASIPK